MVLCKFGCGTRASYGFQGEKARFCNSHQLAGMVNVKSKRCEYEGCDRQPTYNIPGETRARFCSSHQLAGMVDVKNKRCEYEGCDRQPTYNIPGETRARFCSSHQLAGMVDVKHKHCEYEGCETRPTYNIPGETRARFCNSHQLAGMVNVKSKRCEYEGCGTRVRYGLPGNYPSHCAKHRVQGMIRRPRAKCKFLKCKELAIYGQNFIPIHCEIHKTSDEQNYVERECISCKLIFVLDKDNRCEYCNPESFKRASLAKQTALTDYLDSRKDLPKSTSTDTIIDGGICGKERPDRTYEFPDKVIIVECDEHQHRDRQCDCEQMRMVNIGESYGGLPVYFIRWNPDDYTPENDKKFPELLEKRHKMCGDVIRDIIKKRIEIPKALVSVTYLYYDDWDGFNNEWDVLRDLEL